MPFRLDRFLNAVETFTDKKVAQKISSSCVAEKKLPTTGVKKAEMVKCLMGHLDRMVTKKSEKHIMELCGSMCIAKSTIKKALKLKKISGNIDDFLAKLNAHGIGGGHLKRKGRQIIAKYDHCYCGWVSKSKEPIPLTYCFCSAGWYKELFEKTIGESINVTVVQSIINGATSCKFIIDIEDKNSLQEEK